MAAVSASRLKLRSCICRRGTSIVESASGPRLYPPAIAIQRRLRSTESAAKTPNFAFVFDIDGVLIRGFDPLPKAASALSTLRDHGVPYMLLTNGGGKHEIERAKQMSQILGDNLVDTDMILQSHTPFQDMKEYKDGTTLVVGGVSDNARMAAQRYGFKNVLTPSDLFQQTPSISPFSNEIKHYHANQQRPATPPPINTLDLSKSLKIDSIFVYNDSRDWALDLQLIIDLLLSHRGYVGTISEKNGRTDLQNKGYQQDGQPPLFFSNPDMWFSAGFTLPRLGQGAFRAAIEGVWKDVTGGAELQKHVFGKPHAPTYSFAERRLQQLGKTKTPIWGLKDVYMVGDNPESDIRGAMNFKSPAGVNWHGLLVRTGVYTGGEPSVRPTAIVQDVMEAVRWGLQRSGT